VADLFAHRLEVIAAEAATALRQAATPRDWLDEVLDLGGDALKADEAAHVAGTTEGTRLHHTLAANITIFPAMNGIPVVGAGGTLPKMNGIVPDRGLKRAFDDPVPLPRGGELVTLEDAGNYITKLPKAEHEAPEWQAATQALILVATKGGPTMLARIGIMRALHAAHFCQET
jgi:hypothetical protein